MAQLFQLLKLSEWIDFFRVGIDEIDKAVDETWQCQKKISAGIAAFGHLENIEIDKATAKNWQRQKKISAGIAETGTWHILKKWRNLVDQVMYWAIAYKLMQKEAPVTKMLHPCSPWLCVLCFISMTIFFI